MEDRYLYLALNLGAISVPFIASFYPRHAFYKNWAALFKSIVIVGIFFIVWDVLFTHYGVWGFNDRYLTGWRILGLPIEEWLFFVTIPYASVFTYFSVQYLFRDFLSALAVKINIWLSGFSLALAVVFWNHAYTFATFFLLGLLALYLHYRAKPKWLGYFFISYGMVMLPFFLINGVLTGSWIEGEVVWYNDAENMGIRLGTIPFEDYFYGMLLIMLNVFLYETFKNKKLPAE